MEILRQYIFSYVRSMNGALECADDIKTFVFKLEETLDFVWSSWEGCLGALASF